MSTDARDHKVNRIESYWLLGILSAVVCEGALRKWVLPGELHPVAFFSKDIVGLGYIFYHTNRTKSDKSVLLKLLSYISAILLILSFLQGLGGIWQSAVITYKNIVLWPLIAANISFNTRKQTWQFIATAIAFITLGMFVLGGKQFVSPASSWLNQYAWTVAGLDSPVATFGGITGVRATGTFSYISGMSEFAVFSFIICLYGLLNESKFRQKVLLIGGCSAAIGCGVESGSRASLVLIVFVGVITLLVNLSQIKTIICIVLFFILSVIFASVTLDKQAKEQYLRRWTLNPDETLRRFTNEGLRGNYWEMLCANPTGVGLGQVNGYAVFTISQQNRSVETNLYEDGASMAIHEAGVLGVLAFCLVPSVLGIKVLAALTCRNASVRVITGMFGVVPLVGLMAGVWHDHNNTAFTWLQIAIWSCLSEEVLRRGCRNSSIVAREGGNIAEGGPRETGPLIVR